MEFGKAKDVTKGFAESVPTADVLLFYCTLIPRQYLLGNKISFCH